MPPAVFQFPQEEDGIILPLPFYDNKLYIYKIFVTINTIFLLVISNFLHFSLFLKNKISKRI